MGGRGGSMGRASASRSNGFHDQRFESHQGEGQLFLSLRGNFCADVFVPDPSFVRTARTHFVHM